MSDSPACPHAIAGCVGPAAPQAELLEWAEAAEQCCLPELRMRCLTEVAHRLACVAGSLASSFSAAAELAGCNHSTLSTLVGLLAAGCGPTGAPRVLETSPAAAVEALEASAQHGSFQWTVERYSQLPAVRGENTYSPYFWAGGVEWRFRIFPGGDKEEAAGHLSGECRVPTTARESQIDGSMPVWKGRPHANCMGCSIHPPDSSAAPCALQCSSAPGSEALLQGTPSHSWTRAPASKTCKWRRRLPGPLGRGQATAPIYSHRISSCTARPMDTCWETGSCCAPGWRWWRTPPVSRSHEGDDACQAHVRAHDWLH